MARARSLAFPAVLLLTGAGALHAAPAPGAAAFLEKKRDILAVAVERVNRAPDDVQRALKAGEERLRRLHADFKVAKSTPPTSLDGDVREMTAAAARARLARSRGQTLPPDPRAERRIDALWNEYRGRMESLLGSIQYRREAGASEAALYWGALREQKALGDALMEDLAYNAPPGASSVEDAVARDRGDVLKRLEDPARAAGRAACVKTTAEIGREDPFDAGPFYRAAGLLPGANPVRKGAFELPPRCRTVTEREDKVKLILRASKGAGTITLGRTEAPLAYDYVTVPPEVPYLIENGGDTPLDVEYIALE